MSSLMTVLLPSTGATDVAALVLVIVADAGVDCLLLLFTVSLARLMLLITVVVIAILFGSSTLQPQTTNHKNRKLFSTKMCPTYASA